jgi:hypothetical protein
MKVYLSRDMGCYFLTPVNKQLARKQEKATGHKSIIFQIDWDYPGLASSLGWNMRTAHKRGCEEFRSTDGTVTCPGCGRSAGHFIEKAQEWLDRHCDQVFRKDVEAYFSWDTY